MAPLTELDANRAHGKPSSQRKGSRKLLSKSPSMDNGPTLEDTARAMTKKLKRKRGSNEAEREDETIQETDLELTQQPPQSAQTPKNNVGGVDDVELEEPHAFRFDANQVRTKINAYLRSGEMKVCEFQERLGVGSQAYYRFMKQSGPQKGMYSDVFGAAHNFFAVREDKGLNMPRAKKAKTGKNDKKADSDSPSSTKKQTSKADAFAGKSNSNSTSKDKDLKGLDDKYDVGSVELPGESTDSIPVYDTCADIRTKIQSHLRTTSQTQAAFGRMIQKTCNTDVQPITSALIKRFLDKKGPCGGNTSPVFYAAYVYFEKVRVKANKKKTKKREEMEEAWGMDGFDTKTDRGGNRRLWLHKSETAHEDKYGRTHIISMSGEQIL